MISPTSCQPEAGFYRFEVVDQGTGMSDEERCRAFDHFFRADASDTVLGGTDWV